MFERRLGIVATLISLILTAASAPAQSAAGLDAKETIRARLTEVLTKAPRGVQVGLAVADCESGAIWFESGAQTPLKPASVLKLFTTAAALERFGPQFVFRTRLFVADDELLIIGGGDPGLGDERLAERRGMPVHAEFDAWANLLKARGVTHLRAIVLDDSIFDHECRHPEWPADQALAWYQAPLGGINFNDNCLDASFRLHDGKAELTLRPPLPESFYHNQLRPGKKHAPRLRRAADLDVFEFDGTATRNGSFGPITVGKPTVFFGYALQEALLQRGITSDGEVVRRDLVKHMPPNAEPLDVRTTKLEEVLYRCNTNSQNMFAECLLKSLEAYNPDGTPSGDPGSWAGGTEVLRHTLEGMGLDLTGAIFRDGSGLGHGNRVTAALIVALLLKMHKHPHAALYEASLAQPGKDGTLRTKRWDTPALQDRLRAKTGSISGVYSLAGYITRPDGTKLAFALLLNDAPRDTLRLPVAEILAE